MAPETPVRLDTLFLEIKQHIIRSLYEPPSRYGVQETSAACQSPWIPPLDINDEGCCANKAAAAWALQALASTCRSWRDAILPVRDAVVLTDDTIEQVLSMLQHLAMTDRLVTISIRPFLWEETGMLAALCGAGDRLHAISLYASASPGVNFEQGLLKLLAATPALEELQVSLSWPSQIPYFPSDLILPSIRALDVSSPASDLGLRARPSADPVFAALRAFPSLRELRLARLGFKPGSSRAPWTEVPAGLEILVMDYLDGWAREEALGFAALFRRNLRRLRLRHTSVVAHDVFRSGGLSGGWAAAAPTGGLQEEREDQEWPELLGVDLEDLHRWQVSFSPPSYSADEPLLRDILLKSPALRAFIYAGGGGFFAPTPLAVEEFHDLVCAKRNSKGMRFVRLELENVTPSNAEQLGRAAEIWRSMGTLVECDVKVVKVPEPEANSGSWPIRRL